MITRGSKFFFAAAVVGYLSALFYGFITGTADHGGVITVITGGGGIVDSIVGPVTLGWKGGVGEHVGYSVLMAFAASMAIIGGFTTATRDADARALAELEGVEPAQVAPAAIPAGLSWWPLLAALGAGVVVVGLVYSSLVLWGGVAIIVIAGLEWLIRAWSERATEDASENAEYRSRLLQPIEIPLASALVIAVVAIAISKVLLAIPRSAAIYLVIALAVVIFGVANLLARRPQLTGKVLGVVVFLSIVAIIAAGIAGGVAGTRDVEEHHGEGALGAPVVVGSAPDNHPAANAAGI